MKNIKKLYGLLTILTIAISFVLLPKISSADYIPGAFVTTWKTDNPGVSNSDQIKIDINNDYAGQYNYDIDWGDGNSDTGVTGSITHTYSAPGTYTVSITGTFPAIYFDTYWSQAGNTCDNRKLLSIEQWGNIQWKSMNHAFAGASNMVLNATDNPDLTNVYDMSGMFAGYFFYNPTTYTTEYLSSFNSDISDWDVSHVQIMQNMFQGASSFNQDISDWNVSSVTNMYQMFTNASSFNNGGQPLDWGEKTGHVSSMYNMFSGASSFNQDISNWNVSNVTNMSAMFLRVKAFNQNLNNWDTSKVTDMSNMFWGATAFNQDISSWNVSSVTNMYHMFTFASSFNQDISDWNVSNVTNMSNMFMEATAFNNGGQPLDWGEKTVNVTNMREMFLDASSFNQDISNWNVSNVTNMSRMFVGAKAFNQNLNNWDTSKVTNMYSMFTNATSFNQDISSWNVSSVSDMSCMFCYSNFNNGGQPLVWGGKVSNVTKMPKMFYNNSSFNQDISSWDVSSVTDMSEMFKASALSIANYDSLLKKWSTLPLKSGVTFEAGNSLYYDPAAVTARQYIIDTFGWTITDAGLAVNNPKLTYTGNFRESYLNNGAVAGQRNINFNNKRTFLTNTFVNKGSTLTLGTHYNITPKINGLTFVMTISSDGETATLTYTGRAKKHTDTDSVNNLTITFYNSAFATQTVDALNITGKTDSTGKVLFKTNTVVPSTVTLYATDGAGKNPNPTNLYILNQSTGAIETTVGPMGHSINGLDFHPTTGVLYGNTSAADSDGSKPRSLFTIDKETGQATWLGTIKDPDGKSIAFADIAFRSDGNLYARANWGEEVEPVLFQIDYSCPSNICTANPVSLVEIGQGGSGGLGFNIDDVLYIAELEENGLYKVDSYNGEVISNKAYVNITENNSIFTTSRFNRNDDFFAVRINWGKAPADLVKIDVNTGAITSVSGEQEHMIFMTALAFDIQGTTLYHGQTIAEEGTATLSGETQQVMITSTTDPVRIVIEDDVTDPKIILTSLISSETKELPQMEIVTSIANVYIPAGEISISDLTWDGQMKAPTEATAEIPVANSQFSRAMEVGSPGIKMIFKNAVKIVMPGEAGKKIGYFNGGGEFKKITTTCLENSQSWANSNLATEGDCKIDVGTDLVIWTKHFTKFATYTEETTSSSSGSRVIGYRSPVKVVTTTPTTGVQVVNPATTTTTYNFGTGLIKQGQRSNFVKELQKYLNINLSLKLAEDGIFGPMTKSAVILFQKNNGLTPDGLVGPATKGKMK